MENCQSFVATKFTFLILLKFCVNSSQEQSLIFMKNSDSNSYFRIYMQLIVEKNRKIHNLVIETYNFQTSKFHKNEFLIDNINNQKWIFFALSLQKT